MGRGPIALHKRFDAEELVLAWRLQRASRSPSSPHTHTSHQEHCSRVLVLTRRRRLIRSAALCELRQAWDVLRTVVGQVGRLSETLREERCFAQCRLAEATSSAAMLH